MTEIRSIHGLGELSERGKMFRGSPGYIPYLSMTAGEMRLALLEQQARVYAAAYPEDKQYAQAAALVSNALNAGVSKGFSFVGALDGRYLQAVAAEISKAARNQRPAARIGIYGRKSLATGIGDIPVKDRYLECLKNAKGRPNEIFKCQTALDIERILNDGIIKCGHHVLYKNLKTSDNLPQAVAGKMLFHKSGIEGLANVGEVQTGLMYDWVETAILEKNATGGVGPIGSRETSFVLGRREQIGEPVSATVIAIATLVTAALGGAVSLLKQMQAKKAYAMSEARGFGTSAISAETDDWDTPVATGDNTLLIGGALLAAYLLSE